VGGAIDRDPIPAEVGAETELPVDRLDAPTRARPVLRRLFDPARGWFRNAEREASHWLSQTVYPRLPGVSFVYNRLMRSQLSLSEARIALRGLPPAFDGLRVLLLTDHHVGPFCSPKVMEEATERLMALEPDLVLVAGDLVLSRVEEFATHRRVFTRLRAPLGVFAVLGNHDHYTGEVPRLTRLIARAGIELLTNRSVTLERAGQKLSLAGVDDLLRGAPDIDAALDGTASPVILMSHNPDLLFEAQRRGVALMLSGHTHAGQIRLPRLGVIVRQSRYRLDEGRYRAGETELVVSRGLGAVGVPLRIGCPPEAVMLTLTT
jgi:predicted MPP superfamily phosphohydrolase